MQSASEVSAITRQQYLAELRSYLQFMETEERDAVLREYTEKFEAAEDETTLLANLESPMRVAIALRKSYAPIRVPTDVGEPRNQGHTAGETISAPETDVKEEAPAAEEPTEADVTDETPGEEAPAEEEGSDLTEADAALEPAGERHGGGHFGRAPPGGIRHGRGWADRGAADGGAGGGSPRGAG